MRSSPLGPWLVHKRAQSFDAGDYNLFRYCHNDPEDLTDPMGTEQDWAQTGAPISGNHTAQAIEMSAKDRLELFHWQMSVGAIGYGMAAYAYTQMQQAMGGSTMGQARGTAEASSGRLTPARDKQVFSALGNKYNEVSAAHLDKMSIPAFWRFQRDNNTAPEEFYNPKVYQYRGALTALERYHNGIYSGHDMNYMAVGEGFAARGVSTEKMANAIVGWRYGILGPSNVLHGRPFGGLSGGEYPWALVGYYYYQGRSAGMGY